MRRRLAASLAAAAVAAVGGTVPAVATTSDAEVAVRVEQIEVGQEGDTTLTFSVSGLGAGQTLDLADVEIVENGTPVEGLSVVESSADNRIIPGVAVAFDVSGSTQGEPIAAARDAAVELFETVGATGARLGLVSFGETTETVTPLGESVAAVTAGVRSLEATGGTALYDGVSRAARMLSNHDGPRDVILFSDGEDTTSTSGLDDVRAIVTETEVRVTSVALQGESGQDLAALQAIADASGGSMVEVEDTAALQDVFASIAADLTNRVTVGWTVPAVVGPPTELSVVVTYRGDAGTASDGIQAANLRLPKVTEPVDAPRPQPLLPAMDADSSLALGIAGIGLASLLAFFLVLAASSDSRRQHRLDRRLAAYGDRPANAQDEPSRTLADRATSVFDTIPRPTGLDERIAANIEYADWPLRVGEFLLIVMACVVAGALVPYVLTGSLFLGLMGLLLGGAGPFLILRRAITRRRADFEEQLPTVLQVLSGALRAGHAFSTALDGAVDEVDEPARGELRRASVEARLGRAMDQALLGVAIRMDSTDFRWAIGALAVQREVGGNLAEVLTNVATTLRDRASVKRQVRALTAEGRLSAAVISGMPFVLFAYLAVSNPAYTSVLFTRLIGRLMLITGAVLLFAGIVWLRKLVQPKF